MITNKINNKKYIGQTIQTLEKRWKRHCWESTLNRNNSMAITKAIAFYGKENFLIEQIMICNTQEELNLMEQFWIQENNTLSPNGYNLTTGGNSKGSPSVETRLKIAKANTGKKATEETKIKLSESHKGWKPSEETKEKWRKAFSGKQPSKNTLEGAIKYNQKTYKLINPLGETVEVTNLKEFCKKNNFTYARMNELANNKRPFYKGWTIRDESLKEGKNETG